MKKIENQKTSIYLTDRTIDIINDYPNYAMPIGTQKLEYKVSEMVNSLHSTSIQTRLELKNYFTVNEAAVLCDIHNGYINPSYEISKQLLILNFIDACELEHIDEKWNIDKYVLINKLEKLTTFQVYVVKLLINMFWDSEDKSKTIMKKIAEIFLIDYEETIEA